MQTLSGERGIVVNEAEQVGPQSIPGGSAVTVPDPRPVFVTIRVCQDLPPKLGRIDRGGGIQHAAADREVVQVLPDGNGLAVLCRICSTWAGVRFGLSENISETTPVTCGVAMLVP